jgi:uncharacterized protein (TIGR03435 family)
MRAFAIVVTWGALLLSCGVTAQAPLEFEVASIRPNVTREQQGDGLAAPQPGGRFLAVGATLRRLVADAYDGMDVVGGPAWVSVDRFDVNARAAGEPSATEIRRTLRPLLADRFKLIVRTEARDMPVYELRVARTDRKLGPKVRESDAQRAAESRNYFPAARPGPRASAFNLPALEWTSLSLTAPSHWLRIDV